MSFLWTPTTITEPSPKSRFSPAAYARTPLTCRKCRRELVIEAVLWLLLHHEPCSPSARNGEPPKTEGAADPRCRRRRRHREQDAVEARTAADGHPLPFQPDGRSATDANRQAGERACVRGSLPRPERQLGRGTGFTRADCSSTSEKTHVQGSASERPVNGAPLAPTVVLETLINAEAAACLPPSLLRCRLSNAGRWDPDFKEVIQLLTNIERESLKHYQDVWRGWQWELTQKEQHSWLGSLFGGLGRKKAFEDEDITVMPPGGQTSVDAEALHGTVSGNGGSRKPFLVGKIWRSFVGSVFNTNTSGSGVSRESPDAPPSVTPSASDVPIAADNAAGATSTKGNVFSQRFRFRQTSEDNAASTLSIGSFPSTIQPFASVARRLLGGRTASAPLGTTDAAVSCTKCQVWINEKAVCYCSLKRECFPCSLSRLYYNDIDFAGYEASSEFDQRNEAQAGVQNRKRRLSRPRSRSVPTFRRHMEDKKILVDKVASGPSHTASCRRPWVPIRWHLKGRAMRRVRGNFRGKSTAMSRIKDRMYKRYRAENRETEFATRRRVMKESSGIKNLKAATLQSVVSGIKGRRAFKHRNWSSSWTLGESNVFRENEQAFNETESDPGAGEVICRSPECYTSGSSLDDAWNREVALKANSRTGSVRLSEPSDESDVRSFLPSSSMCEGERAFTFKENEVSSWSSSFFSNPLFGRATFEGKRPDDADTGAVGGSSEESAKPLWLGGGGKRFFNAFFFCAPLMRPADVEKVLATAAHDVCIPSFLRILPPTHYITLLHGLNGRARDYRKFRELLLRRYPDIHCFVPDCYGRRAFLGILPLTKILRDYLFVCAPHPALGNPRIPRSPDLLYRALSRSVCNEKLSLSKNDVHFSGGRYAVGPDGNEILTSRIFLSFVGHSLGGILARSLIAFNNCNFPRWPNKESTMSSVGVAPSSVPLTTEAIRASSVTELPFLRGFAGYTSAPEGTLDEISGHPWWTSLPPIPVDRGETPWSLSDVHQPVRLLNFATFASPHNGTFEDFLGVQALSYLVPTGRDLMTASQELQRLASPEALLPLTRFQTLSLYGNVSNDFLVGPLTSLLVEPQLRDGQERRQCLACHPAVESLAKVTETPRTPKKLPDISSSTIITRASETNVTPDGLMPLGVSPNSPMAPVESLEFPLCARATCIRYDRVPIEIDAAGYVIESLPSEVIPASEEPVSPRPSRPPFSALSSLSARERPRIEIGDDGKKGERSLVFNAATARVSNMKKNERPHVALPEPAFDTSTRPVVLDTIQTQEAPDAKQRGTVRPTVSSRCAVANCIHQQLNKRCTIDGASSSSVEKERKVLEDPRLAAARAEHKASFIWLTSFSNAFLQVPPRPYSLRRHHHGVRGAKHNLRKCELQGSPRPSAPSTPQHFNFSLIKRFHRDTKYLPSVLKATFPLSWTTASDASSSSSPILSSDISDTSVPSVVYPASCPESPSSAGSGTIFRPPSFSVAGDPPTAGQQRDKVDAASPTRRGSSRSAACEKLAGAPGSYKELFTLSSASEDPGRHIPAVPEEKAALTPQSRNLPQHPYSTEDPGRHIPAVPDEKAALTPQSRNLPQHPYSTASASSLPEPAQPASLQQTSVSPLSYVRHLSRLPWRRFGVYIPSTFFAHNCIIWHSRLDLNDLGHPVVDHFLNSVFVHCAPTWCCNDLSAGYRRAFTPSLSSMTITMDPRPNAGGGMGAV